MFETVLLLFNPIAGKGNSEYLVRSLEQRLLLEGFSTRVEESSVCRETLSQDLLGGNFIAAIIAGGDGTVGDFLALFSDTRVPIYNLPTGNQSLFAKEFGMSVCFDQVVSLLKEKVSKKCYVPLANDRSFFTMASVGFDSQVVEKVSKNRSGPVGNMGYVFPTFLTAVAHRAPEISLTVDGEKLIDSQPGYVIVANCKQYALSMEFLPEANPLEKSLVARFFPYSSVASYLKLNLKALFGKKHLSGSKFFQGESFLIESSLPFPVQVDGDYVGYTPVLLQSTDRQITPLV